MMAIKLLPILQVIVILGSPAAYGYPAPAAPAVYGTKRYGRLQRSYEPQPRQSVGALIRTQRYPFNYYEMYPYSQAYPEEYYYEPMSYPVYYPRTSKYEVYQAVLPYYYDRPIPVHTPGFNYYGYDDVVIGGGLDPIVDIEEDMLHEADRKQREDAQAIGQETYFEDDPATLTDDSYNYNDVNAAFLNNLILSQLGKSTMEKTPSYSYDDLDDEVYGKVDEFTSDSKPSYYNEDEEVQELKSLAHKQLKPDDRLRWFQKGSNNNNKKFNENYYDEYNERKGSVEGHLEWFTDRADRKATIKPTLVPVTTTTGASSGAASGSSSSTTTTSKKVQRGQKEEVLPRPATPVKHPFTMPVMNNVYKKDRQRQPSVYDTIKHMLDMEKSLEKNGDVIKPAMRKRIIASEDSLTHQLSGLKKHAN